MSRQLRIIGVIALTAIVSIGPALALTAKPADLPALEQAWHSCVRQAYDGQQDRGSRAGRERSTLDEYKPHEDAHAAARMAARPDAADAPMSGWARTCAAYVVDPVEAWIEVLQRRSTPAL